LGDTWPEIFGFETKDLPYQHYRQLAVCSLPLDGRHRLRTWDDETARRYMKVANAFRSLPDRDRNEDITINANALYALASPRVPQIVRDDAVERATKGERITKAKALLDWAEEPLARTGKPRSTRELRGELVAHTVA
jgi:hypothetical protein